MVKLCIATGNFFNPHETQGHFHIQNLFEGDTVVLSYEQGQDNPFGVPAHIVKPKKSGSQGISARLVEAGQKLRSIAAHSTARVPYGARRRSIQGFLKDHAVDAVLSEFGTTAVRFAPVIKAAGIPHFTYFRGADASSHLREPLRAKAYRKMMPNLSGVFAVSQFLLDNLAAHGVRHPNSHVVPSGVDTDLFLPGQKVPNSFLAVGRFIEKKRPDITVQSFCSAAKDVPDARLEMVGDGPLMAKCQEIAAQSNMTEQVVFHGKQPHDFVRQALARNAVFLQHSVIGQNGDTEGLPTAIQEAMSAGLAVVSTRHAGIPEAITEGENGYLVDEFDASGFEAAIKTTLSDPDAIKAMGQVNRAKAQARFDNRTLIKTVEVEIKRVLA